MRCLLLPLLIITVLLPSARAIQLGDSREQIVAQYGNPTSGKMGLDREVGTYRWPGWRLDVEMGESMAQRLVFIKDSAPISDAEQHQLLNDNGGFASWQSAAQVAVGSRAGEKWQRVTDGAQAFTLAEDPRVMCLVTRRWTEGWMNTHETAVQPPRVVVTGTSPSSPTIKQTPTPSPLAGLIVLAGFAGCVAFLGRVLTTKQRSPTPANGGLWTTTMHLKSACTVVAASPNPPAPLPKSAALKPKALADLSWQEFELVIGELYRRQGYTVELCAGDGSDGGVDLTLHRDGQTILVQCKHWKTNQVGVSTVRELFGVLTAEKADHAILVTTGKFTQDARRFATGKPLELIEGNQLDAMIRRASADGRGDLLDVASWSHEFAQTATVSDPVCPLCRSAMVLRVGRQSGSRFWGCSTYPRCRGKRNVRSELMQGRGTCKTKKTMC